MLYVKYQGLPFDSVNEKNKINDGEIIYWERNRRRMSVI
jgi:hypothetical protein